MNACSCSFGTIMDSIDTFLQGSPHAVVGASRNRDKYGNKVLCAYQAHDMPVHVVHPREDSIEGVSCVASVDDLPDGVWGMSIITPPKITEQVVERAAAKGIKHLWMQPGAESELAVSRAQELGMTVISGGPCLLIELPKRV